MVERESVIRNLLDERGLKYSHFCESLGIPPYTFSRIESGVQKPPDGYYAAAARYFEIPEQYLLKLIENADRPEAERAEVSAS